MSSGNSGKFNEQAVPPRAQQIPVERQWHGVAWVDEFDWLRADNWQECVDDSSLLPAEIKDYLNRENAWCEANMADTTQLQATLLDEMRGRIQADDESLPDEEGAWAYVERYRGDDEYPSYWRMPRESVVCNGAGEIGEIGGIGGTGRHRKSSEAGSKPVPAITEGSSQQQLLIDFNVEAEGHEYFCPGDVEYSPDHRYLAWSIDTTGSERHTVTIRNLQTGHDEDVIDDVESVTWGDSQHLFYTRVDSDHRPSQVFRHKLGSNSNSDERVYEERDPRFFCSVWTSLSARFVFISADMNDQSEVWFIPSDAIASKPVLIEARTEGLEYNVEHQADRFLILTNADGASDFKIMQTPCASPSREHWQDWLPSQPGRMVLDVFAYRDWVMWMEREEALPRICYARSTGHERKCGAASTSGERQREAADGSGPSPHWMPVGAGDFHRIDFDEEAYALSLEPLLEFDEQCFRFGYESPSTPEQSWRFDMTSTERTLLKQEIIPSGHDPADYVVRRLYAGSCDGESVPITVLRHRKTALDGSAPCWLTGYGAYGSSMPASFSPFMLSLVDRGFVFALAHVRGGQEKGRAWYEAARFGNKHRSVDDLVAVGQHLVEQNYTAAGNIVLSGASAGGLLIGAALNSESELWGAAIADVPFVDVLHTLLDETLPLTPGEWTQWGNPIADARAFSDIRKYCPYTNVQGRSYPPMLVTAGVSDSRVTYWEPAKWVARHRQRRNDNQLLLLKTNMHSGHFGESGRYAALADVVFEQAFALKVLGLIPNPP